MRWLRLDVGFDAWRFDFVKGAMGWATAMQTPKVCETCRPTLERVIVFGLCRSFLAPNLVSNRIPQFCWPHVSVCLIAPRPGYGAEYVGLYCKKSHPSWAVGELWLDMRRDVGGNAHER